MTTPVFSDEIFAAASLHLNVVDDFIAIAQAKLATVTGEFARDSMADLLAGLDEQREAYRATLEATLPVTALAA
ncbi:hypothetical protein [Azospirillum picis]|uniref:Uncharacterized protein n=1 Tax=Azospirillum picis TaxID=488438 RepID=A0ABU0MU09_9PROT|nr:hypothetical protein [Azospirillum picis]MBP2303218.1 hypothetical protein [Azospirillum picis]MDQ0536975.1 hypothetical protein [Azospirillum picis]